MRKRQFILTLVADRRADLPGPMYRLRTALKRLLRSYGLRCINALLNDKEDAAVEALQKCVALNRQTEHSNFLYL